MVCACSKGAGLAPSNLNGVMPFPLHAAGIALQRLRASALSALSPPSRFLANLHNTRLADYMPGEALRFDNPIKHGASSLLLLLDVALSRLPVVSYHLQVCLS